ncbi:RNA-binding protein Nova-1 isoform X1 [Drosophila pseudoobscura]|uniref:RNA-binding protein Nova-1 isoform X1 n=1 Tax=Drosophila pseudoobscura pseudoobscura TaxID=46245 RepID=A0A6I8WF68_DROPS|nr:RNA-binding protein Nova-1 isoform X1 [Drosophila pseudoobscura]XP_033241679.1 RNA-binding protein Nova-1 isoform X1 [Drosophila pseudoobscura]
MDSITTMKTAMDRAAEQLIQQYAIESMSQEQENQRQELQRQQQLQQQQQEQEQEHFIFQYQLLTPTHMPQLASNYQPRHSTNTSSSPSSTHSLASGGGGGGSGGSTNSNSNSYSSGSSSTSTSGISICNSNITAAYSSAVHSYHKKLQANPQYNIQHHQMELQQSPLSENGSPNATPGANTPPDTTGATSVTALATATATALALGSVSVSASASVAATAAASTSQQQALPLGNYKTASCWCYGESVCSGIEVEIENNNNNHIHHGETTYHMKILVPAVASGAIIGKGGETIASLQKDTGARVKMSKSHDFYPGTTERVCLITGSTEAIMVVLDFIMDKIREKPDLTTKIIDAESKQTQERDKQVKILVPNSTAGMIIGKGGAFIKQIKEDSGSYVQISQKPKDVSLQERCITIIGDKENNKNACKMILSKIVEDPQSGTCLNVSYADVSGPVANFNPTGSPYATNQNAINSSTASLNSTLGTSIGGANSAASLLVNGTGINLSINLGAPNPAPNLAVANQLLEHIKVAMRGSGYSETVTTEVCNALGVLAKYGVLGMGVGVPHTNGAHSTLGNFLGVTTLDQQTAAANAANASNVFGAVGQVNLEQYAAAAAAAAAASRPTQSQLDAAAVQFDPFRHLGSATAPATPVSLNNNSFGLTAATGAANSAQLGGLSKSPTPGDLSSKDSKNVEVPEMIIGAILGPNGRSLVEIQHVSGANVQISKKGIFAPGTRNRIVTITGQPNAIAKAQFLIEQKITEEETKRARQIPLTTVVN